MTPKLNFQDIVLISSILKNSYSALYDKKLECQQVIKDGKIKHGELNIAVVS